jgi:hypothetical protein
MTRSKLNFSVDTFAFACFILMIATGLLLAYILPSGSGRLPTEGWRPDPGATGLAMQEIQQRELHRPILLLWGLTRHEWANIHLYIGIALMAALLVHFALHWRWVTAIVKGRPGNASALRAAVGLVGLACLLMLAAAPFLSSTSQMLRGEVQQRRESGLRLRHRGNASHPGGALSQPDRPAR